MEIACSSPHCAGLDADLYAGIDFGGTKIAVVIAAESGEVAAEEVIPTHADAGPSQAVSRTCRLVDDLRREHRLRIQAIGIGLPGLIDREKGSIVLLPNLPASWRGFRIADAFEAHFGIPIFLSNDARTATLGEYTFGNAADMQDMLFVTVGTGIGGGLVLDGRLHEGIFGAAGELGHQTILPNGALCGCGNRGCLETLFSGPVLAAAGMALLREGRAPALKELVGVSGVATATEMAAAAQNGDAAVAEVIQTAAEYLGIGIANAVTMTAVREVVLGGGLCVLGDLLLEPVRRAIRDRVRMFPSESVQVRFSTLGSRSGALGGVALAAHEFSRSEKEVLHQAWR